MDYSFKPFLPSREQLERGFDDSYWTDGMYDECLRAYKANPNCINAFWLISCLQNYIYSKNGDLYVKSHSYYEPLLDNENRLFENKKEAAKEVLHIVETFKENPYLIPAYYMIRAQNYFILGDIDNSLSNLLQLLNHDSIKKRHFDTDYFETAAIDLAAIVSNIRFLYYLKGNKDACAEYELQYDYVSRYIDKMIQKANEDDDFPISAEDIFLMRLFGNYEPNHYFFTSSYCVPRRGDSYIASTLHDKRYHHLYFDTSFELNKGYLYAYDWMNDEYEDNEWDHVLPFANKKTQLTYHVTSKSFEINSDFIRLLISLIDLTDNDLRNAYNVIIDLLKMAIVKFNVEYNQDITDIETAFQVECTLLLYLLKSRNLTQKDLDYIESVLGVRYTVSDIDTIFLSVDFSMAKETNTISICVMVDNLLMESTPDAPSIAEAVYLFMQEFGDRFISGTPVATIGFESFKYSQTRYINENDLLLKEQIIPSKGPHQNKTEKAILNRSRINSGKIEKQESSCALLLQELNALVGLKEIKADVENLISLVRMQKIREDQGLKSVPVSLHLVFTGNPGTGKTTVARILAKLYKEIGVIKSGQLIEVDRSGLVAGYIGQTAIKTQEKIKETIGGILFIDEAYTLAKDGNDYGQEAIDTILKAMEDYRNEFVVIVAGYDEPMRKFINSNPGLKSRFNKFFHFPDYSTEELIEIFAKMCKQYEYKLTNDAETAIWLRIEEMEREKTEHFANARDIRNYFESIITKQASRVGLLKNPTKDDVTTITIADVKI